MPAESKDDIVQKMLQMVGKGGESEMDIKASKQQMM